MLKITKDSLIKKWKKVIPSENTNENKVLKINNNMLILLKYENENIILNFPLFLYFESFDELIINNYNNLL